MYKSNTVVSYTIGNKCPHNIHTILSNLVFMVTYFLLQLCNNSFVLILTVLISYYSLLALQLTQNRTHLRRIKMPNMMPQAPTCAIWNAPLLHYFEHLRRRRKEDHFDAYTIHCST